ncbi:MAG: N-acetylmuramoyl-L-alanine amidase [Solirubrobacteraceae bacterium]
MAPPSGRPLPPLVALLAAALALGATGCGSDAADPDAATVASAAVPSATAPSSGPPAAPAATTGPTTTGKPATTPGSASPERTTTAASAASDDPPLTGRTVVVDPGHNGANGANPSRINRLVPSGVGRKACNTTGTESVTGLSESRFNWLVAGHTVRALRARGAKVVLTRRNDRGVGPCVDRRAAIANDAEADVSVSIHADGGPSGGRGFHVILPGRVAQVRGHDRIVTPSRRLGRAVRDAFRRGTGLPHSTYLGSAGLDTRTDLGGLNLLRVPGVMLETGNMRNARDARRMADAEWRRRAGRAIARGVERFLVSRR